jgi:four helix bundle protein
MNLRGKPRLFSDHCKACTKQSAFSTPHVVLGWGAELKDFRDLKVWAKAHVLTLDIYGATATFPREELFGLTSQMRRCSVSIGANIAEGAGKRGNSEFQRFLQIAAGSASELDYHLLLARDLGFLTEASHQKVATDLPHVRKMLTSLIQKIEHERLMSKC